MADETQDVAGRLLMNKGTEVSGSSSRFHLDVLALELRHDRRLAMYSWYFPVGASFEVFALTLALTMIVAGVPLAWYWLVLVGIYFFTGVGFIAFSLVMMKRLREDEEHQLTLLRDRYGP